MLIKLKQSEIEEALRDFIVKQGFNLDRKTVDISFTAGRGDSGMTADLDIHDAAAVMGSAQCSPVYETQASASVGGVEEATPAPQLHVVETSPAAEDVLPDPQEEEPVVQKASLFGG
ncbi:hypothetical protein [Stutzerimonas stutzeri]|uniref:Uncharacterized protein n=1 Tax=Stutzerimonas stutzeri TaxID=316 RepID=A0AA42TB20_STUST|nr:hypothetical protein [Stutzerimonas stutzeri]MDH1236548.1 hypothetical protein [Stutzerimonas stutzeri]